MIHHRIKQLMLMICLAASSMECFARAATEAEPTVPVTAIWNLQQLEFTYRSGSIYYSCDTLRRKIAGILTAVGAREDVEVNLPCRPGTLTNNAFTAIRIATPVEATPQNVAAATSYSTQAQLVARLNKIDLPTANDIHRFPAEWRTINIGKERRLYLEAADCDLVRALAQQVFPQLAVRLEKGGLSCPGGASSRIRPKILVTALRPTPVLPMAYATVGK